MAAHLRGISCFVMGSYPTQGTPALAQLAQLGSFWSQRFLRNLQRLQALTLRKLLPWPALPVAFVPFCRTASLANWSLGLWWLLQSGALSWEDCRCLLVPCWWFGDEEPCDGIAVLRCPPGPMTPIGGQKESGCGKEPRFVTMPISGLPGLGRGSREWTSGDYRSSPAL